MADNTSGQPIGTARVEFVGDTSKLKASADEAQKIVQDAATSSTAAPADAAAQKVDELGKSAAKATEPVRSFRLETEQFAKDAEAAEQRSAKFAETLEEQGESAKRQIGKVKGFIGAFAAIGGIAVGMYALGRAIREGVEAALESGRAKAERFAASLDFSDTKGSLAALDDQLKELQSRLAANQESFVDRLQNSINGNSSGQLRQQISELERDRAGLAKSAQRRAQIEKADADAKALAEENAKRLAAEQDFQNNLRSLRTNSESDSLSGEAKIAYDTETRIIERDKLRKKATADQQKDIDAIEQLYRESAKRQVDALRQARDEEMRDRERKERDSIQRIKQMQLDAINEIRNAASTMFQTVAINVDISRLEQLVKIIAEKREP